jgi:hypothetical protein
VSRCYRATSTEWPTASTARPLPLVATAGGDTTKLRRQRGPLHAASEGRNFRNFRQRAPACASVRRTQALPRRVRPLRRRPPLSALPGHIPAQEARCSALGARRWGSARDPCPSRRPALRRCAGGALAVRWRCAGGALAVRWRCAGGAPGDTGDGLHERHGLLLSGQARGAFSVQPRTGGIQIVPSSRGERAVHAYREDMVRLQPTDDRLGEGVPLGAQLPTRSARRTPVRPSRPQAAAAESRALQRPRTSVTTAARQTIPVGCDPVCYAP